MPFALTLGFATEHDRDAFIERVLPKVRGKQVDPVVPEGVNDGLYRIGVAVTSQSAAKDVCHQIISFLAHAKSLRVNVFWIGADGQPHTGDVNAGAARDAEVLAMRVATAARASFDVEKEKE